MAPRHGMGAAGRRFRQSLGSNFVFDAAGYSNLECDVPGRRNDVRTRRSQMIQHATEKAKSNLAAIKALTFLMFMMFAMTTDSVGVIIPEIIKQFGLSMTAAGAFHYATMGGIALAGVFLRDLPHKPGPQATISLLRISSLATSHL